MRRATCSSLRARLVARKWHLPSGFRLNSTFESPSTASTSSDSPRKKRNQPPNGQYTIFARTWDHLRSPLDTLAIVQYLGKAFGPVEEFRSFKSSLMVRFRDAASAKRALKHTATIPIPAPPEPKESRIDGGLGLDDFQPYLERQEFDPALTPANNAENLAQMPNTILVTLSAAPDLHTFQPRPDRHYFISTKAAINFVKWAGFAAIKPIEEGMPLDKLDHEWMRRTVRRHARNQNLPNPLEFQPGKEPTREPYRNQSEELGSKPPPVSGKEWVAPVTKPSTSKSLETTPSAERETEWEPLPEFVVENTSESSFIFPKVTELVEPEIRTADSVPVTIIHHETSHSPTEQPTPPPAEQPSQAPHQPTPPDDIASQALAASQIQQANAILQQLNSPKLKQGKQGNYKTAVPNSPKRQQPRTRLFLESEASEDAKPHTDLSSGVENPNTEQAADGRLKKFLGGWF
ncbi:hypothetical protein E1B28_010158 [Marasmius oreades]|uniref:Uncharacterized protein n=1 Tax=Marasmius oreades TaxID=181124 RepID=A0A9P7RX63_9AGAR|nr:uncharacterized protein E1B28_010158 [Marasmius oreades]KAG7091103.1 hypothetical protein E1B28_010158 [Marasmius oreades]